jgi:hypothetical protein
VTRYGLDGPGIEIPGRRDFPYPSRWASSPNQPPVQGVPGLFPGVKRPECGVDQIYPFRGETVNGKSYNSTHPLCCDGKLQGELFLILNTVTVTISPTSLN